MNEDSIPNPGNPIAYFFILTIIYAFFTIYNIDSQTSLESIQASDNSIYILIYIALLLGGSYFINLGISKGMCKNSEVQYSSVFFATILPWLIVFGLLYFLLKIFTSWVRPFSNTIGYAVINFMGLKNVLHSLKGNGDESVKAAISKINTHPEKFINEFDHELHNYDIFVEKLRASGIFKNDDKATIELFKLVNIKHAIGEIFWYILAGTLVVSISYNYIINITCQKSVEETQKEFDELYNDDDDSTPS